MMTPGAVYSLIFSDHDDSLFMTVLHVKDENDIIDLIEEYGDYYHLIGYIAGHENFYILEQCKSLKMNNIAPVNLIQEVLHNLGRDNQLDVYVK